MKTFGIAVVIAAITTTAAGAQTNTITGTVVDTVSNTRVAAAQVVLLQVGSSSAQITDATGMFRFRAQPGPFKLVISALGYSELQSSVLNLGEKENLTVLIYLTTQPVEVMPVYVVAKSRRPLSALDEFEQRMKRNDGFGYFMDLAKINKMQAWSLHDILKRIPGANVLRNRVMLRPDCQDAVYVVDGVPVRGMGGQTATDLVEMVVPVTEIAGIEVYKGDAGIPGALVPALIGAPAGDESCGLIAIWLKR